MTEADDQTAARGQDYCGEINKGFCISQVTLYQARPMLSAKGSTAYRLRVGVGGKSPVIKGGASSLVKGRGAIGGQYAAAERTNSRPAPDGASADKEPSVIGRICQCKIATFGLVLSKVMPTALVTLRRRPALSDGRRGSDHNTGRA